MTERKDFKKVVRDRMKETGENFTAARAALEPEVAASASRPRHLRPTLQDLTRDAFKEAGARGNSYVGPGHALLAMLNRPDGDVSRRVLVAAGMTPEIVERKDPPTEPRPIDSDITVNPRWHRVYGRAEGLALSTGDSSAVMFLVAMLWDDGVWASYELDVPRARVIALLNEEGLALPPGEPPEFEKFNFTQRVEVPNEDLRRVVLALADRRGEDGPLFAFNSGADGVGYVACEDGMDLQGIVDEVLRGGRARG